jgi:carbon-monoxide dehydrogenase large subunit
VAAELGLDPVAVRRKNLIPPFDAPHTTVVGAIYDVGDYGRALDEAVRLAGYDELRAEQKARRERGDRLALGIGVSVYVEITGGPGAVPEFGSVEVHPDGTVTAQAGTSPQGQGHETAFAQIVSAILGVPMEAVRIVHSDTAAVPEGQGTYGSRSLQLGGSSIYLAAEAVLEMAKQRAANLLEANPDDVVIFDDGRFGVAGTPARSLGWDELAAGGDEPLRAETKHQQGANTYPFGAHIAVAEVDTETGAVNLQRMVAVDDCGRILNPMLAEGQVHGGLAQGIAQALFEGVAYDADGTPLTTTLADYLFPSAAELPSYETAHTETPTFLNPLGAKGIGESGTIGSTPAVQNAVVDAVSHLGVRHIDMPLTPERVWRAIQEAQEDGR